MKQLVYFIGFGMGCINQFELCTETIRRYSDIDILLVTDQDYKHKGIHTIKVVKPSPPPNGDADRDKAQYHSYFTYRTYIHRLTDLSQWDRVWYMDTDFILKGDLFSAYADMYHVYLCKEPGTHINDIHFCGALTAKEIMEDPLKRGINAGLYSIPKQHYAFFNFYHTETMRMQEASQRAWLSEQHILNMIYVRHKDRFSIRTFNMDHIGFPAKKFKHTDELAMHYACYPFEQKLTHMTNEANR